MSETTRPTFREVRETYGVELEHIVADTPVSLSD